MDDFSLSVSSRSAVTNCIVLEEIITMLFSKADNQQVQFEPEKTELIHFHNKRSPITTPLRIGALVITPKEVARYLGVWFDAKLSFKPHVEKRVTAATAAFYGLQRLATTQRGLSFSAARRLYIACITSITDYGVQVWWRPNLPYNIVNKYQKL